MKIFVAGHRGLVGSAIVRQLIAAGHRPDDILCRTSQELNLCDATAVARFFAGHHIDQVYFAAAKVGGVVSNNLYPAESIYKNLLIQTHVIDAAYRVGVQKLLFIASTCVYPKFATNPIVEDALLTGHLESTNEPYAIAKLAGIKMCESYNRQYGTDYRSVLPCNLFGPGDNYHPENGHVAAGVIRKLHYAKVQGNPSVQIWGTGTPRREFLYVDDMANACITVMNAPIEHWNAVTHPMQRHINIGCGKDMTIADFVSVVAEVVGYTGTIEYDTTKPDGTMNKLTDNSKLLCLGWKPTVSLSEGLARAYDAYLTCGAR